MNISQATFRHLIDQNLISKEILKDILQNMHQQKYSSEDNDDESFNLLVYIVKQGLFKDLVDVYRNMKSSSSLSAFQYFLVKSLLFDRITDDQILTKDDVAYLLNQIETFDELSDLFLHNFPLKLFIVENHFLLDKAFTDKFNALIESSQECSINKIMNIFECLKSREHKSSRTFKLIDIICEVSMFEKLSVEEKQQLVEIFKTNEDAKERLRYLNENHLETDFDFESLMNYLTKKEKKHTLNI